MRYIGLLKATPESEAGVMPPAEMFEKMGAFMEEVVKAGVLVGTDGLKASSFGTRVKLDNGSVTVTDGPFTESKELIASYALFQMRQAGRQHIGGNGFIRQVNCYTRCPSRRIARRRFPASGKCPVAPSMRPRGEMPCRSSPTCFSKAVVKKR